ncbi:hypothetical protein M426DRAFT_10669 [Hypoxylon sp. CI-4A]|nr:hypothetical protein M426DRAFT_10669 [Hypoxylon sp. CI-4A]
MNHPLNQSRDAPVERFPPELRRHLLSFLDLDDLRSFVHASPTYHQQYLASRRYLLCHALHNTIGPIVIDAFIAHKSGPAASNGPCTLDKVLEYYRDLHPSKALACLTTSSEAEVVDMVRTHQVMLGSISILRHAWKFDPTDYHPLQGFYRYEILCRLLHGDYFPKLRPEGLDRDLNRYLVAYLDSFSASCRYFVAQVFAFISLQYDTDFRNFTRGSNGLRISFVLVGHAASRGFGLHHKVYKSKCTKDVDHMWKIMTKELSETNVTLNQGHIIVNATFRVLVLNAG